MESLKPLITFAGGVLAVVVLYWGEAVLVPIALAILISFVLTPPVVWLERWIGRVPAVLAVVTLVFVVLGLAGWGLMRQMENLADDLPRYRVNILSKVREIRGSGRGGTVEQLQDTLEDIKTGLGDTPARRPAAVMLLQEPLSGVPGLSWLGPILGPLGTAGLVVVLVIFILLEQRDLRNRLISLFGQGRVTITTKALDEAGHRISRQLLMQSLVSLVYGVIAGLGLWALGVPYPLVWGALGAALRYIPYVGPMLGAGAPILVSLAAMPGWSGPLSVVGMFVALELFTNLVLETVLYAGAAGISQVGLLVSVAFWTWLWGPLGLLMATPLTVCLVVLSRHAPGLSFIGTLMADEPALPPEFSYYQRLLARDPGEAADIIERHVKTSASGTVYDALLLPALNYAKRDRIERRLSDDEETMVIDATRDLLADAGDMIRRLQPTEQGSADATALQAREPLRILGYPAHGPGDEVALAMLSQLLGNLPIVIETTKSRLLASELIALVQAQGVSVVCIADLPPSPPSKTRYLVKRMHAALPDVRIVVGRWGPPLLADESTQPLREAGATHVSSTLAATRDHLSGLVEMPAAPDAPSA